MEFPEVYQLENISKTVDVDGLKVILVEGREGSGKSTILKIFSDRVEKDSIALSLNCVENSDLEKFLETLNFEMGRKFFKEKGNFLQIFTAKNNEKLTLEYVSNVLDTISNYKKIIIFLENIENAKPDVLKAITYISQSLKNRKIMFVLTYNTDKKNDAVEDFILKLGIFLEEKFKRIRMHALTKDEEKKLLEEMGYNLPDYVFDKIHTLTEGNLRTLLRLISKLKDNGYIDIMGFWVGKDLNFPLDTVDKKIFIIEKFNNLDKNTRDVLKILAIFGTNFTIDEVEKVTGINEFMLIDGVDRLVRDGILIERDFNNFSFSDEEIQKIVYNDIVEEEIKNKMHLKIAEFYEGKDNIKSAMHYYKAGIKDKAKKFLRNAAIEYANSYNFKRALEFLDMLSTLDALDDEELLLKGICYLKISEYSKAISIFDRLNNDSAKIYKAYAFAYIGEFSKAESIISEIEKDGENEFHKKFISAYILSRRFNLNEALISFEELLEKIEKDDLKGDLFREIGNVYYYLNKFDMAKEYYLKSLEYYKRISYYEGISRIYNNLALIEINKNVEKGLYYYNEAIKYADLSGNDSLLIILHYNIAYTDFWLGRILESQREINIAMAISEFKNEIEVRHSIYSFLSDFNLYSGNFYKSIDYINEAIHISEKLGSKFYYHLYKIKRYAIWIRMGVDVKINEIMEDYEKIMNTSSDLGKIMAGPFVGLIKLYKGEKDALMVLEDSFESAFNAANITNIVLPASNLMFGYILNKNPEKFKDLWDKIHNIYEKQNVQPATFQIFGPVYNFLKGNEIQLDLFENKLLEADLVFLAGIMHLSYYIVSKNEFSKRRATEIFNKLGLKNYEKFFGD